MRWLRFTALLGIPAALPSILACQDPVPLAPGERIRVRAVNQRAVGTLLTISGDTLIIAAADPGGMGEAPVRIPRWMITRVEVSRGWEPAGPKGARVGAVIGLPVGLLVAVLRRATCTDCDLNAAQSSVLGAAAIGMGVGAVLGYAVGSTRRVERWEPVVGVGPAQIRVGVRVSP